jgi:hypothetical protein
MADRSKPRYLSVVEGGRAHLERQLLRAIVFDLPEADELARRLEPSANSNTLQLIPIGGATRPDRNEPSDEHGQS